MENYKYRCIKVNKPEVCIAVFKIRGIVSLVVAVIFGGEGAAGDAQHVEGQLQSGDAQQPLADAQCAAEKHRAEQLTEHISWLESGMADLKSKLTSTEWNSRLQKQAHQH
jgi:hypothetical protein